MSAAAIRVQQRKAAKESLAAVAANAGNVAIIHYSCESFYDRPHGKSPRITSIAIRNLNSGQTTSFSIHQIAERDNKLSANEIEANYDELEKRMLDEFYDYVEKHPHQIWLHWNMRDINYGFAAIAHRYKVLGGRPVDIHETQLVDLARILVGLYGVGYAGHPRLNWLVDYNKITNLDFLSGADEAKAFESREYVKLHQSTLRKADILAGIYSRTADGTLKTNARLHEIYGSYGRLAVEIIRDHWVVVLIGVLGSIASIVSLAL